MITCKYNAWPKMPGLSTADCPPSPQRATELDFTEKSLKRTINQLYLGTIRITPLVVTAMTIEANQAVTFQCTKTAIYRVISCLTLYFWVLICDDPIFTRDARTSPRTVDSCPIPKKFQFKNLPNQFQTNQFILSFFISFNFTTWRQFRGNLMTSWWRH